MSIEEALMHMKEIQNSILEFIENQGNIQESFQNLVSFFNNQKIKDNKYDLLSVLHLLTNIAKNHYHVISFFDKIDEILKFFKDDIKKFFTNFEIFNIFKINKRVLLFLIKEKIITINEYIVKKFVTEKYVLNHYHQYFSPEIKPFITEKFLKKNPLDAKLIQEINQELPNNFNELRKAAENESIICQIIRNDSVEELQNLIDQSENKISFKTKIEPSIYDNNTYAFINKTKTNTGYTRKTNNNLELFEYAAFNGSFNILKSIESNKIQFKDSIWFHAIHGNNLDIINFLEEKHISKNDQTFKQYYKESIKCHHNSIAEYIKNNHMKQAKPDVNDAVVPIKYHNYAFLNPDFNDKKLINNLCHYDYPLLVKIYYVKNNAISKPTSWIQIKCFDTICDLTIFIKFRIDFFYDTPFILAIKKGNLEVIKVLMNSGKFDINEHSIFSKKFVIKFQINYFNKI